MRLSFRNTIPLVAIATHLLAASSHADQAAAVAAVEKLGGKVFYDDTMPDKPVFKVDLAGTKVTDTDLPVLQGLDRLRSLYLGRTKVTDAGMAALKGMPKLAFLDVRGTQITDAAFVYFKDLPAINHLGLEATKVTNAHLKDLKDIPTLRDLIIDHTPIGDSAVPDLVALDQLEYINLGALPALTPAGLKQLAAMTKVKQLGLARNAVPKNGTAPGDDTLQALAGLTQLTSLDIRLWNVTDIGLATVEKMTHLQTLIIWQNPITDEGLKHLYGLSELSILDMRGTKATAAGIDELQKHLPRCRIIQ